MSLLGKILAIVNVFAVIGVLLLGAMDYGKRQEWSYAYFLHGLALDGLPVTGAEKDPEGHLLADKINDKTRASLFNAVGGQPVSTQVQEVERVHKLVQAKLDEAGPDGRVQVLTRILLPLARTNAQREDLLARKANADALQEQVELAFQPALLGKVATPEGSKDLDPDQRRQAIAHLLFVLLDSLKDDDAADPLAGQAYPRYLTVVGLEAGVRAVNEQARILETIPVELAAEMQRDLGLFVQKHQALVYEMQERALEVERQNALLASLKDQTNQRETVVKEQKRRIKQFEDELADARQETGKQVKELRDMSQKLYGLRVEVRDAEALNQKLEKKIRDLEAGR